MKSSTGPVLPNRRDFLCTTGLALSALPVAATGAPAVDAATRRRSWDDFRHLIDRCADLGPGGIMVLGSGKQRSTTGGATVADAEGRVQDGVAEMAQAADERGVTILLEPLAPHLSNVVTSLGRAAAITAPVGSAAVATMFDFHREAELIQTTRIRSSSHSLTYRKLAALPTGPPSLPDPGLPAAS